MDKILNEDVLIIIFNYVPEMIFEISQVCKLFNQIVTNRIRQIKLSLNQNNPEDVSEKLATLNINSIKLSMSYDQFIEEKSVFCNQFSEKITSLILRHMTFLNPIFEKSFNNLDELIIYKCDLTSCTNFSEFIIVGCKVLTNLKIIGCSGLDIEELNSLGKQLYKTNIIHIKLKPNYSYFDVPQSVNEKEYWTIEKLKTLSIRSKLVVMKKNFIRNVFAKRSENLRKLELIADIDFGEQLITRIIQNYPKLEYLAIGKGCSIVKNDDFLTLCNHYKNLKSLEFHFSNQDDSLDLSSLEQNESIRELCLGINKNVSAGHLALISQKLPNIGKLQIIQYNMQNVDKAKENTIVSIFSNVKHIELHEPGGRTIIIGCEDKIDGSCQMAYNNLSST